MSDPAIRVEKLGKRYLIGNRERYLALRDLLANALKAPIRLPQRTARGGSSNHQPQYLWALRDVSFDVHEGEVLGLIGRNGAGKTTLLKILARITRPAEGWAEVRGRVGSLLEVGTGFHPELTGRENVYLSGAILGMKKKEVERKFDEIVSFADVAKHIDTPLKYYSTGMQTRLAFAVAAHLEPDILLVDEVLAVGDIEFQKKCIGKMSEAASGGRTILFVSHQMNQIRRLCQSCIWIDNGSIRTEGSVSEVVNAYEKAAISRLTQEAYGGLSVRAASFAGWEIVEPNSAGSNTLSSHGPVKFRFNLLVRNPIHKGSVAIHLRNIDGQTVWASVRSSLNLDAGLTCCEITMPYFPLVPGPYHWEVFINDGHQWINEGQCLPEMSVEAPSFVHPDDHFKGFLNVPYEFRIYGS